MDMELVTSLSPDRAQARRNLLTSAGLEEDNRFDTVALLWQEGELAATACRLGNLLKCIAVSPIYQGQDLTATVLTVLRQDAFRQGYNRLFLYTKPRNRFQFSSLLFHPVAQTQDVLLMEDRKGGVLSFLDSLPKGPGGGKTGAAVMNCNPFTRGHRYLIETAARQCDHLLVFVLSEDRSRFSAKDRLELVKLGTADLPNVTVLPTGPYLISSATFPTYFLKEREKATEVQCLLDIEIFTRYYGPHFGITHRFVGTEPLSPMTGQYNEALKTHLPPRGIQVVEIPRLEEAGGPISASRLRAALDAGDWSTVEALVPETTLRYLKERHQ